jgi:hypothetical protein
MLYLSIIKKIKLKVMLKNQLRIELLGNYEEPTGEFAPGEKYSHIQFCTKDQYYHSTGEEILYSIFDHNVLEDMDGYRIYNSDGKLFQMSYTMTFWDIQQFMEREELVREIVEELKKKNH